MQLLLTAGIATLLYFGGDGVRALLLNPVIVISAIIGVFATMLPLVCCGMDKSVPINYILLFMFTACEGYMVGIICLRYPFETVIEAVLLTASVCIAITLYAMTTKTDFTILGPIVFILGFVFCTMSILGVFFGFHNNLFFASLGVILFSLYLLIDT